MLVRVITNFSSWWLSFGWMGRKFPLLWQEKLYKGKYSRHFPYQSIEGFLTMPHERSRSRRGSTYYKERSHRGNSQLQNNATSFAAIYHEQMLEHVREELSRWEREASSQRTSLSYGEVRAWWESQIPYTRKIRSRGNEYMQTINLYWQMKFLLGRALLDNREARRDLLQMLDHMHGHLRHYDCRLEVMDQILARIERHIGIPRATARPE